MWVAKAMASLRICADSPESSLLSSVPSTEISCTDTYRYYNADHNAATYFITRDIVWLTIGRCMDTLAGLGFH